MLNITSIKKPAVAVPVLVGLLLPCLIFVILHFARAATPPKALSLIDAVYFSGTPLPTIDLKTPEGQTIAPETLRKGKVLLVFITTDCPACKKELTLLSQVDASLAEKVKVYGVGVQAQTQVIDFLKVNQFKTNFLFDQNGDLMKSLHVKYFPARFLVEDGVITKTTFGNSRNQEDLFRELGL